MFAGDRCGSFGFRRVHAISAVHSPMTSTLPRKSPVLRQRSRGGQIVDPVLRDFAASVLLAGLCGGMLRGEVARALGGCFCLHHALG
jgi:hypothetical protein